MNHKLRKLNNNSTKYRALLAKLNFFQAFVCTYYIKKVIVLYSVRISDRISLLSLVLFKQQLSMYVLY